jgi:histidine triad (HIT) family protein
MKDCVFCSIVAGTIQAANVYQDEDVFAFMDANPINPGHVLVIPRSHLPDIQELDDQVFSHLMLVGKKIARALNSIYSPKKVGFAVAGFDIPHAHLHIVPLHDYHDLTSRRYLDKSILKPPGSQLDTAAAQIHSALSH